MELIAQLLSSRSGRLDGEPVRASSQRECSRSSASDARCGTAMIQMLRGLASRIPPQTDGNRRARLEALGRRNRKTLTLLHEAAQAVSDDEPELADCLMRQARQALSWWRPIR
jgi:predicted component of type VI protein secretion system